MTLSFVTRWRDELPATYTTLSPTPLNNARLIWHNAELANTLSIPSSLFKNGAGVWGGETLLPGMSPLAQVYSGHQRKPRFSNGLACRISSTRLCPASSPQCPNMQ